MLDELDFKDEVVVNNCSLSVCDFSTFVVDVEIPRTVVLLISGLEDVVGGKLIKGREDVANPRNRAPQFDKFSLGFLADDSLVRRIVFAQIIEEFRVLLEIVGVGLQQDDTLGVFIAKQRNGVIGGLFQVAERDDIAVGLH